ncbi:cytochrome p450 3a17 [Fusarium beomiforme]|uniref:Cytochrome p450 3a17 n=1 Tax=Fusarium beomiforme TaxID=44412 RepID=A0A9P5AF89_9HYPO|nr:cytochrome p450 3a17 [Fusarium beomiforme]
MRMSDRDAGPAINARLEPLGRTALNIIYADKSEPQVAIKATGFWLDGEMYDHAAFAEDSSETFKREAIIYNALGPHEHILKSYGVAYLPAARGKESEPTAESEREAWALKLERAPNGNLRERILKGDALPMAQRLSMALNLADTLQYVHSRGVIWGDISTRNILLFENHHIKLSDFAGSSLRGVYPDLLFACEPRYWIPTTNPPSPERSIFEKELFSLGTGICEITEWALPYGELEIEELQEKLMRGEYPDLSEDNPAKHVIRGLWNLDYRSVQEVADALRKLTIMLVDGHLNVPLLAGVFLGATLFYVLANALKSPLRGLPGPWYTRFTHLVLKWHILTGNRVHYIHALHQRYGPVVRVAPGEVAVSDLEAFSKIHKIGSGFLKSSWYDGITPNREAGIFVMRDPHQHAARRKLFARAFSVSSLVTNWEPEIRQKAELAVSKIRDDAKAAGADIFKWWTLMATDVIAHLSFGESFRMLELGKQTPYIDAIQSSLLMSAIRSELSWIYPIFQYLPFQGLKDLMNADKIVFDHGSLAVRNMQSAGNGFNKANLFSQMLAASDSQEKTNLSTLSVQTEASNLIVAGSDTTAVTLTYLIWAVIKHPKLQAELEHEISELSDELTFEELKNAPLLNSVIEETLRLYGAAPGALPRVVPGKGLEVCSHYIPPGTVVSTQAFTLHRNENIFEDAQRFDGYRFMDKSKLTAAQKTALSPFGAGSRICIGLHLAWMELRLGAALFFRECRGARLGPDMTDEVMEMENQFLIAPKGHNGGIFAFKKLPNGRLELSDAAASHGEGGVYLDISRDGKTLSAANIDGSTVSIYPLTSGGRFGDVAHVFHYNLTQPGPGAGDSQEIANPHAAVFSPCGNIMVVPDRGADRVYIYQVHGTKHVELVRTMTLLPGTGPRHAVFSRVNQEKTLMFLVSELDNTINVFSFDYGSIGHDGKHPDLNETLRITHLQRASTLEDSSKRTKPTNVDLASELALSYDRRFLYVSNRNTESVDKLDTIAIYSLDVGADKPLQFLGLNSTYGKIPRHFSLSSDSRNQFVAVANQVTNDLFILKRDLKTGFLDGVAGNYSLGKLDLTTKVGPMAVIWD